MPRGITKNDVTFLVNETDEYREFWDWYESDTWEPDTVAVFARFLRPETRYLDLGAWIGPTALLAAHRVARVICVEPDPLAYDELRKNLDLNPNLARKTTALPVAAGARDARVTLRSTGAGGDSHSSLVRSDGDGANWTVEQVSPSELLSRSNLDAVDFVKSDVEGAEYDLVPALLRQLASRPTIYIATHPNLLVDKRSLSARLRTSLTALAANRRLLRALLAYRHHYVYDEARQRFRDVRRRNVWRVILPLPIRASFVIGAIVCTDEQLAN